jgi:Global regulator protein family
MAVPVPGRYEPVDDPRRRAALTERTVSFAEPPVDDYMIVTYDMVIDESAQRLRHTAAVRPVDHEARAPRHHPLPRRAADRHDAYRRAHRHRSRVGAVKGDGTVRLVIEAPRTVQVLRGELEGRRR